MKQATAPVARQEKPLGTPPWLAGKQGKKPSTAAGAAKALKGKAAAEELLVSMESALKPSAPRHEEPTVAPAVCVDRPAPSSSTPTPEKLERLQRRLYRASRGLIHLLEKKLEDAKGKALDAREYGSLARTLTTVRGQLKEFAGELATAACPRCSGPVKSNPWSDGITKALDKVWERRGGASLSRAYRSDPRLEDGD